MKHQKIFSITMVLLFAGVSLQAQFLKKLKERVQEEVIDKVADRVADELADKIAEDLANRIYKPMDKAIEDAYRKEMADSLDNDTDGAAFSSFMSKYAEASDKIQSVYKFEIVNHLEIEDHDGKIDEMKMYFSEEGEYFGMETEDKGKKVLIIYDFEKEIMAMYSTDGDKKEVQGMPFFLDLAVSIAGTETDKEDYLFEKTGKTKTILGYYCEEYKVESDGYLSYAFVTKDFPAKWEDSFGKIVDKIAPLTSSKLKDMDGGMALYSESAPKSNPDKKSFSVVTKVDLSGVEVITADYSKVQLGQK